MPEHDPLSFVRQFLAEHPEADFGEVMNAAAVVGIELNPVTFGRGKALERGWVKPHRSEGGFPPTLLAGWSGKWPLDPPLHTLETLAAAALPRIGGDEPAWDEVVLSAPKLILVADDEGIVVQSVRAELVASGLGGFTAGELLLSVHNAVAEVTTVKLEVQWLNWLGYVSEEDGIPTYELHCES